jgi:preprotein translocase subunit SecG
LLAARGNKLICGKDVAVALTNLVVLADGIPGWVPPVMNVVLILSSLFMILLVLIQRGKGGGLSGAFGGAGGSSAFGSRAGDTFTRITIYAAAFWVLFIMITIKMTQPPAKDSQDQQQQQQQDSNQ